jgi:hypothetical protein
MPRFVTLAAASVLGLPTAHANIDLIASAGSTVPAAHA